MNLDSLKKSNKDIELFALTIYNEDLPDYLLFNQKGEFIESLYLSNSDKFRFTQEGHKKHINFQGENILLLDPLNKDSLVNKDAKKFFYSLHEFQSNLFGPYSYVHNSEIFETSLFIEKEKVIKPNTNILNVGCGTSFNNFENKKLEYKLLHGDLYDYGEIIKDFKVIDINTRFAERKFEIIWCFFVLEHLFDPLSALENLMHATVEKGEVWIVIPVLENRIPDQRKKINLPIFHYQLFTSNNESAGFPILILENFIKGKGLKYQKRLFKINGESQIFFKILK